MTIKRIFDEAEDVGDDIYNNIGEVLESGLYSARHGEMTHRFEQAFAKKMGVEYAIAVNSGTSALFVALLACGIGPGDKVIVPALGPAMTAHAVLHAGATPVFADIDPETYCLDPTKITDPDSPCFVLPVHIFGSSCDMATLLTVAEAFDLVVIEDCAQSLSKPTGEIACYSFEQAKHICTGDGGMVVTNEPVLAKRIRQWSDHGIKNVTASDGRWMGPAEFEFPGYNFRMPELSAAVGLAQIDTAGGKSYRTEYVPDDKRADEYHQHLISSDDVEFARAPWDRLVYGWPAFGNQKGLCPVAERVHPNLFIFPVK